MNAEETNWHLLKVNTCYNVVFTSLHVMTHQPCHHNIIVLVKKMPQGNTFS